MPNPMSKKEVARLIKELRELRMSDVETIALSDDVVNLEKEDELFLIRDAIKKNPDLIWLKIAAMYTPRASFRGGPK